MHGLDISDLHTSILLVQISHVDKFMARDCISIISADSASAYFCPNTTQLVFAASAYVFSLLKVFPEQHGHEEADGKLRFS